MHEARTELRTLRAKIAELESKPSLTSAQQAQLDRLSAAETAATNKEPDFLEDPKGYVDARMGKTAEELKAVKEENAKFTQAQQHQQQVQQLLSNVQQHEQSFLQATPDYHQAVDHIRTVRASQLQMLYPQATPQQIQQQISNEEIGAAAQVLRGGGNPAEFAYNYAKTMGYQPKAPTPDPKANGAAKPDKDAVRSMGGGGGGAEAGDNTPADDELGGALQTALAERFGVRKRK